MNSNFKMLLNYDTPQRENWEHVLRRSYPCHGERFVQKGDKDLDQNI